MLIQVSRDELRQIESSSWLARRGDLEMQFDNAVFLREVKRRVPRLDWDALIQASCRLVSDLNAPFVGALKVEVVDI